VLRGRGDRCCQSHPTAADVFLLVEVADSSVDFDRGVKLPLYGRHGIPEVWLVELNAETIEVHRKPRAGSFEETRRCRRGETLVPAALPDLVLRVDELLG
jgi:Uma2 family endonuclease